MPEPLFLQKFELDPATSNLPTLQELPLSRARLSRAPKSPRPHSSRTPRRQSLGPPWLRELSRAGGYLVGSQERSLPPVHQPRLSEAACHPSCVSCAFLSPRVGGRCHRSAALTLGRPWRRGLDLCSSRGRRSLSPQDGIPRSPASCTHQQPGQPTPAAPLTPTPLSILRSVGKPAAGTKPSAMLLPPPVRAPVPSSPRPKDSELKPSCLRPSLPSTLFSRLTATSAPGTTLGTSRAGFARAGSRPRAAGGAGRSEARGRLPAAAEPRAAAQARDLVARIPGVALRAQLALRALGSHPTPQPGVRKAEVFGREKHGFFSARLSTPF